MSLVLDSSAVLAWIYADETTDAMRRGLPLATLDTDLRAAATAENVDLMGM